MLQSALVNLPICPISVEKSFCSRTMPDFEATAPTLSEETQTYSSNREAPVPLSSWITQIRKPSEIN